MGLLPADRRRDRRFCILATSFWLLLLSGQSLSGQDSVVSRSWGAADGFPESFVNSVQADGKGSVWAIHGTAGMSRLDGYTVDAQYPKLLRPRSLAWTSDGLWTLDNHEILHLRGRNWEHYALPEAARLLPSEVPHVPLRRWSGNRVVAILPDRVAAFDLQAHRHWIVFKSSASGLGTLQDGLTAGDGSLWLAGTNSVARCAEVVTGKLKCFDYVPALKGLRGFHSLVEDDAGGVLVAATRISNGKEQLLRWGAGGWSIVWSGGRAPIRAAPGPAQMLWVQQGNSMFRIREGTTEPIWGRERASRDRHVSLPPTRRCIVRHRQPGADPVRTRVVADAGIAGTAGRRRSGRHL